MPRPKGEPTKVVRLPVAFLEPFEAEAKREGMPLVDVLAARMVAPGAAPRATRPSAPGTAAQGRTPKVTHPKPTGPVPVAPAFQRGSPSPSLNPDRWAARPKTTKGQP